MRIYSEICNVKNKISKDGKNGKPYYQLVLSYEVHSEKNNQDYLIDEFVMVPQSVYDAVSLGQNIRLVGLITYDRENKRNNVSYYGLYEGKNEKSN